MALMWVPDGLTGQRVDSAAARMTGLTRARVVDLIQEGKVNLAGQQVIKPSEKVKVNDLLEIDLSEPVRKPKIHARLADGLKIIHEDADIIVVDKPAGVAAHPSLGWDGPDVVSHLVTAGFAISTSGAPERKGIVQRLDVGTSGLMVVAKSERAYTLLKRAFRQRQVHKIYHALVQGIPDPLNGTIDAPIGRHPGSQWKFAVTVNGRSAITHYEALEVVGPVTLLKINLETGRTHQIRVHMAAVGHPCVGDPLYGCDPTLAAEVNLDRQWLHAVELSFIHPGSSQKVVFHSEPAQDLQSAWHALSHLA